MAFHRATPAHICLHLLFGASCLILACSSLLCRPRSLEQSAEVQNSDRPSSTFVFSPTRGTEFIPQPVNLKHYFPQNESKSSTLNLFWSIETPARQQPLTAKSPGAVSLHRPWFKILPMLRGCSQLRPERTDSLQHLTCVCCPRDSYTENIHMLIMILLCIFSASFGYFNLYVCILGSQVLCLWRTWAGTFAC